MGHVNLSCAKITAQASMHQNLPLLLVNNNGTDQPQLAASKISVFKLVSVANQAHLRLLVAITKTDASHPGLNSLKHRLSHDIAHFSFLFIHRLKYSAVAL